jgi:hypothetical protein
LPKRAVYAVLAWGAATATAMAVVWTGLDAVLPTATEGPHVATIAAWPVQDAASTGIGSAESTTAAPSAAASAPASASAAPSVSARPSGARSVAPAPSTSTPAPPSSAAGTQRRYSTVGGTAVITLYPASASLDAAIPADGYSARSWQNADLLEVEFTPASGGTVYEVIVTWNGTPPQVQTVAVGG